MSNPSGRIRVCVGGGLLVAGLVLGVIPQACIPVGLTPVVAVQGDFSGDPVLLAVPEREGSALPVSVEVRMIEGTCRVGFRDDEGVHSWGSAKEATLRGSLLAGSELVLDPQGNRGTYDVLMGAPWHWLGPKSRRFILLPCVLAMAATTIFRRRAESLVRKLGLKELSRTRQLLLVVLPVVSGLVLYPAVHESGHLLAGALFGGKVDLEGVAWTPLAGEEPHASFSHLPDDARPWMSAGGTVLPTAVALLLLTMWRLVSKRASWFVSWALVGTSILFLLSTVGCLFELNRNTHLDALSVHLGLTGFSRVLFSLSPLLVAVAVYTWLAIDFRNRRASRVQRE